MWLRRRSAWYTGTAQCRACERGSVEGLASGDGLNSWSWAHRYTLGRVLKLDDGNYYDELRDNTLLNKETLVSQQIYKKVLIDSVPGPFVDNLTITPSQVFHRQNRTSLIFKDKFSISSSEAQNLHTYPVQPLVIIIMYFSKLAVAGLLSVTGTISVLATPIKVSGPASNKAVAARDIGVGDIDVDFGVDVSVFF